MRETYNLEGLDCPVCAGKVEAALRAAPGVRFAAVDFASLKLDIEADDVEAALAAARAVEPGLEARRPDAAIPDDADGDAPAGLRGFLKRFGPALAIGLSLALLAASLLVPELVPGWTKAAGWPLTAALAGAAWLLAGRGVLWQALRNLRRGQVFDENFLMTIASLGAFALGEFSEAAAVMVFYLIGETLQDRAVDRSRDSIRALLALKPDSAWKIAPDGTEAKVAADSLLPGDRVRVRPGERVPADGTVETGEAGADTAALTGESLPRTLKPGAEALAGFVVLDAAVVVRVEKPATESGAARIVALVEQARSNKAQTERFITRFARWYTPAVVGLATATALTLWLGFGFAAGDAVHRALVMLVISCPCALVVSVPLAYFGGIGGAARRGILVKGAAVFDALRRVRTVVFDKTGTLTHGRYEVKGLHPAAGVEPSHLLHMAALAEKHSNHPAARAIDRAADNRHRGIELTDYQEIAGYGVSSRHEGRNLLAGGHRLLHRENIPHDCVEDPDTRVHVAHDGEHLGSIAVGDRVRDESAAAVAELRRLGVAEVVMLTGDAEGEAARVAAGTGIDRWKSSCLPEDKLAELEAIMAAAPGAVLFAGDGINDAPVIARADVGVAMGLGGQDAAVETADLVIMNDSPAKVAEAIRIARATRNIVVQNIVFALAVKAAFLAAGGFGLAGMWEAVVADVGVALLAVLNSMRALRAGH